MSSRGSLLFGVACTAGAAAVVASAAGDRSPPVVVRVERDPWTKPIESRIEPAPPSFVDVLILGDGYEASDEATTFHADFVALSGGIVAEEPFVRFKERIRFRSRFIASKQRGCEAAWNEDYVDTALDTRFASRSDRMIDFGDPAKARRAVIEAGVADIVLVVVNTSRAGGTAVTLPPMRPGELPLRVAIVTAHPTRLVDSAIHEIGHCFAGLADEYEEECRREVVPVPRGTNDLPWSNVSLWRCVDDRSFESLAATVKWRHFLALPDARDHEWFHRGGYYHQTGVVRPWPTCRMRSSAGSDRSFCPVCDEEVAKAITLCLGEKWDDVEWHRQRPLLDWR